MPAKLGVRSYPVVERDHIVWIWPGDQALADPGLIIDIPYLRDPAWRGVPDYMHYDADYRLIVDNLSDFAHLAFVHAKTLGGSEEYAFKTKPVAVERLENGFRVEDKAIIEGQQRMLDADPDFKMHPIASDAALAHFRRVLERRIEAERPGVRQAAA